MNGAGNKNKTATNRNGIIGDDRDDEEATVKSSNKSHTIVQNECFYGNRK